MKAKAMKKAMKAKTAALAPAMKAMNAKQVEDAICIEELLAVLEIMPAVLLQWSIHSRADAQLRCQAGQLDASVECCVKALQFLIHHRHIDVDKGMVLMVWASEQALPDLEGGPLAAFHELESKAERKLRRLRRSASS